MPLCPAPFRGNHKEHNWGHYRSPLKFVDQIEHVNGERLHRYISPFLFSLEE
jgi:hypothetical protein